MKRYLLDTNVISEYTHAKPPGERVRNWIDAQDEKALYLSALTLGEIRKGVTLLPASSRRSQLQEWLEVDLPARFEGRVLAIDAKVADRWGAMAGLARLQGIALPIIDGLVAATALTHGLTMVTRNVRDFTVWQVPVINPWE
jgi:predicted nucleic acid-binding protein